MSTIAPPVAPPSAAEKPASKKVPTSFSYGPRLLRMATFRQISATVFFILLIVPGPFALAHRLSCRELLAAFQELRFINPQYFLNQLDDRVAQAGLAFPNDNRFCGLGCIINDLQTVRHVLELPPVDPAEYLAAIKRNLLANGLDVRDGLYPLHLAKAYGIALGATVPRPIYVTLKSIYSSNPGPAWMKVFPSTSLHLDDLPSLDADPGTTLLTLDKLNGSLAHFVSLKSYNANRNTIWFQDPERPTEVLASSIQPARVLIGEQNYNTIAIDYRGQVWYLRAVISTSYLPSGG